MLCAYYCGESDGTGQRGQFGVTTSEAQGGDYYEVLGVECASDWTVIDAAYHRALETRRPQEGLH